MAGALLLVYTVSTILSALSTQQLSHLDRYSPVATLVFPLVHFGTLAVVAAVATWAKPSQGLERGGRKKAFAAGAASALGLLLRLWEMRHGDQRVCEALEVFLLPTLLLLAPIAQGPPSSSHPLSPSTTFVAASAASTLLVGFSVIGTPVHGVALTLGLLRLPVEGMALLLLHEGVTERLSAGSFLSWVAASATLTSLLLLPLTLVRFSTESLRPVDPTAYLALFSDIVTSILAQIASVSTLYLSDTSSTAGGIVLPRNFLLLVWSTSGREGSPLRGCWVQVVLVYAAGAVALVLSDRNILTSSAAVKANGSVRRFSSSSSNPMYSPTSSTLLQPYSPPRGSDEISNHDRRYDSPPPPSIHTLLPFLSLLLFLITAPVTTSSPSSACVYLPPSLRAHVCPASATPKSGTVDVVMSYYDEDLTTAKEHLHFILATDFVRKRRNRVVVYSKGPRSRQYLREALQLRSQDDVVSLENVGREGATFLKHILLHYNSTVSSDYTSSQAPPSPSLAPLLAQLHPSPSLADHTYFLQSHLAWPHVALARLPTVTPSTGFLHFGPYFNSSCGLDEGVNIDFPIVKEIFNLFAQQLCPPTGQTGAWTAQFVASKTRILASPYARWALVGEMIEAPVGHWLHSLWGPQNANSPQNPAIGHSVERSWPTMLGCWDRRLSVECRDDVADPEKCQCMDE